VPAERLTIIEGTGTAILQKECKRGLGMYVASLRGETIPVGGPSITGVNTMAIFMKVAEAQPFDSVLSP